MNRKEWERQQEEIRREKDNSDFQWIAAALLIIVTLAIFTI